MFHILMERMHTDMYSDDRLILVFSIVVSLVIAVIFDAYLSYYDVVVIQWITSCHKNRMTTRVITRLRQRVTSLTAFVSTMCFLNEIMLSLKAIKSHFKGSYDKQNLTLVLISYEIYETRRRLVP